MPILIGIYKNIYEVSKFISKHPGEGIHDTYLKQYNRKDATEDFERYHNTNESDEMLIEAKKDGEGEETGIKYVCPYFFKKKIPKYFHFLDDDKYGIQFFKDRFGGKAICSFILRKSNSDPENSLSITYLDTFADEPKLNHLKLRKLENGKWYTMWENDDGDVEDVYDDDVENLVKKIMIDNDFVGLE